MKVIFLDIDGVLNTSQTFIDIDEEYWKTKKRRVEIDLERVKLLKEIVEQTNAVIVMSSSWRYKTIKNTTWSLTNVYNINLKNHGLISKI